MKFSATSFPVYAVTILSVLVFQLPSYASQSPGRGLIDRDGGQSGSSQSVLAATGRPSPSTVPFYKVRIEYFTTSDWSRLSIEKTEAILTYRQMDMQGNPSRVRTTGELLSLNQPLDSAKHDAEVGVIVDYAVAADFDDQTMKFLLEKGSLNGSTVRIYAIAGEQSHLLAEIDHQGFVRGQSGKNPLTFDIDLGSLQEPFLQKMDINSGVPTRMLWAFYYPWFNMSSWSRPDIIDRPVAPYDSGDPITTRRHIRQAKGAGIDGFISSWWGPEHTSDINLRLLLDEAADEDFLISIHFETLRDGQPLSEEEIRQYLAYAISTYRGHPALMKVNGKPVIVVYASSSVNQDTWVRIFGDLKSQSLEAYYIAQGQAISNLGVFDGLYMYNVFSVADLGQTLETLVKETRYFPLLEESPAPKISVATVQPGYDERNITGRSGKFQDREDGNFYRFNWDAAIQSGAEWIFITTWNEWAENTHIEPSELYGEQYLEITKQYEKIWNPDETVCIGGIVHVSSPGASDFINGRNGQATIAVSAQEKEHISVSDAGVAAAWISSSLAEDSCVTSPRTPEVNQAGVG